MQTRGPGQEAKETEPCGQAHPEPVQTGRTRTSPSQLASQHWSVLGGSASQGWPLPHPAPGATTTTEVTIHAAHRVELRLAIDAPRSAEPRDYLRIGRWLSR
jgi:hypothetical protein